VALRSADRLVLDTSAYSKLRVGHVGVIDWIAGAQEVFVPTIVIGELEAGFEGGTRAAENRAVLSDFLSEPFVSVVDVTRSTARHYGQIFTRLRRAGTPIPVNDIWIAACTMDTGGLLLSLDRDFELVEGLPRAMLS